MLASPRLHPRFFHWAPLLLLALADPVCAQSLGPPTDTLPTDAPPAKTDLGILPDAFWRRDDIQRVVRDTLVDLQKEKSKPVAKDYEVGKQVDFRVFWADGMQMETVDKAFRLHMGGLIHVDWGWWNADSALMDAPGGVGPLEDGVRFRRARMHMNGAMYEVVTWRMEVGFETGAPNFFDVFAELPDLPFIGSWRIGHFREPFGLDALTSYNNLTFTERGGVQDPFVPFFNMGTMIYGTLLDEHVTYATGIFGSNSDVAAIDFGDGRWAWTSRLTCAPWFDKDNGYAVHLGVAWSHRSLPLLDAAGKPDPNGKSRVIFASRPETRVNSPNFVNTGVITADTEDLVGAEFAAGLGPLLVQAEYMTALVPDALAPNGQPVPGTLMFRGFYVQASWMMTGENRPYVRKEAIFGAARPFENFFFVRGGPDKRDLLWGSGAWELALRYTQLDLNSQGVNGGDMRALTFGINWYLNPRCRFLWDYLLTWRDAPPAGVSGLAQTFGARFQIEF